MPTSILVGISNSRGTLVKGLEKSMFFMVITAIYMTQLFPFHNAIELSQLINLRKLLMSIK